MANVIINDTNLTNIANAIREKNGLTDTYKPSEMAGAILAIEAGGGGSTEVEPIVLTGDCVYACTGALAGAYINSFGNTISTDAITNMDNMFYKLSNAKNIPFVINGDTGNVAMDSMFAQSEIESLPVIKNISVINLYRWCQSAYYLREISDEVTADWDWSSYLTATSSNYRGGCIFQNCYSLRRIPNNILNNIRNNTTTGAYNAYYNAFGSCYTLDEISDLGVSEGAYTSNVFSGAFSNCYHLKKFTFAVQEDGTPYARTWKSQTIDLSSYIGYAKNTSSILNYNSGLTEATQVKANTSMTEDERLAIIEQYPDDWWTVLPSWSRYTHASAVETINSLPDCSSGSGNTIKFYGASGTSHPEGAISTLTEEEIAVATAKGWTVTLV